MTMAPRVCVLLSTYNGEAFLEPQLASLRAQEGVEVCLQVRDDGSTDGTLAVLRRHADAWPQLADVASGPNLGPAASFLELLRTAPDDADYYAFCDQDDVWLPGKLARAVEQLTASAGEPALYCSNVTCVAEDLAVLGTPRANGDARLQHLLFENIAYGCTTVMNRVARERIVARLPERGVIMHDWWCALVVAALGRVHYDPESQILYRQHEGNTIGSQAGILGQAMLNARVFLSNPTGYYRIHTQTLELLRLYIESLDADQRREVDELIKSKHSVVTRMKYAISNKVIRTGLVTSVVVRCLIAFGWY
jgi:glycosyltransferase involved in cell wall biosynthesis